MPDCFISYSNNDERFAAAVHRNLSTHGLSVFMARISLNPGNRWTPKTLAALEHSTWVIFLASKAACSSPYVQQEIGGALMAKKTIIPVVWEMPPSELPGWVNQIQALDIRNQTEQQVTTRIIHLARQMKLTKEKQGVIIGAALVAGFMWLFSDSD